MNKKITPVAPALSNGIVQGQALGLSTAPQLPESANALSQQLQAKARAYIGARRQSGESLLSAVRALSEARDIAQHGEWGVFLEAVGLDESRARAQIRMHDEAQRDPQFAESIRSGFLSETVARELLPAAPEVRADVLARETPPTLQDVRHAKRVSTPVLEEQPAAAPPPLPDHLAAAGYRWLSTDGAPFVIAGPGGWQGNGAGGWQGNAPTVAGALGLAEDRYQARMSSPQQQPTAPDRQPKPAADVGAATSSTATIPVDITDAARALGLLVKHDNGDLWLYWPIEADGLGDTIPPWQWPQRAEEVRAWLRDDAPALAPQPQPASTPAPADWRRDPALQRAMERFNAAVRGNDRGAALRAARAVVAAIEAMEED